jgi:hypothetical protein
MASDGVRWSLLLGTAITQRGVGAVFGTVEARRCFDR